MPTRFRSMLRNRNAPALAVGFLALFMALSGGAYAADQTLFSGKDIKNGSITRADLARETINSHNLEDGHVLRRDLSPDVRDALAKAGTPGTNGPAGKDSMNGKDGAPGALGAKGEMGDTGATGDAGDTGPQGDAGETGEQGETGDTGETGDQGDTGEEGSAGRDGVSGAVWSSTLNTLLPVGTFGSGGTEVANAAVVLTTGACPASRSPAPPASKPTATSTAGTLLRVQGRRHRHPDANQAEVYVPAGLPTASLQISVVGALDEESFSPGPHAVKMYCYTNANLTNYGGYFSATYVNTVDATPAGPGI